MVREVLDQRELIRYNRQLRIPDFGEEGQKQHLCGDKGYSGKPAQELMQERGYIPHVRQRGEETEEKKRNPRFRARRWVVERTNS